MLTCYDQGLGESLARLCDKYGSDKGSMTNYFHKGFHTYVDYYGLLFNQRRETIKNVFECGLGKAGASLRVWRDYFPKATILGVDIDRKILFQEDRIKTFWVDQTSPEAIRNLWTEVECNDFDLMIDDGLHEFEAGICLFESSIEKLSNSGHYIIEDVSYDDIIKFQRYFQDKSYLVSIILFFKRRHKGIDSYLISIQNMKSLPTF